MDEVTYVPLALAKQKLMELETRHRAIDKKRKRKLAEAEAVIAELKAGGSIDDDTSTERLSKIKSRSSLAESTDVVPLEPESDLDTPTSTVGEAVLEESEREEVNDGAAMTEDGSEQDEPESDEEPVAVPDVASDDDGHNSTQEGQETDGEAVEPTEVTPVESVTAPTPVPPAGPAPETAGPVKTIVKTVVKQVARVDPKLVEEHAAMTSRAEAAEKEVSKLKRDLAAKSAAMAAALNENSQAAGKGKGKEAKLQANLKAKTAEVTQLTKDAKAKAKEHAAELSDAVAKVKAETAKLDTATAETARVQAALEKARADHAASVEAGDGTAAGLRADVARLKGELEEKTKAVKGLEAAAKAGDKAHEKAVKEIEARNKAETARLTAAQGEAGALQAALDKAKADHAALGERSAATEAGLKADVKALEAKVAAGEKEVAQLTAGAEKAAAVQQKALDAAGAKHAAEMAKFAEARATVDRIEAALKKAKEGLAAKEKREAELSDKVGALTAELKSAEEAGASQRAAREAAVKDAETKGAALDAAEARIKALEAEAVKHAVQMEQFAEAKEVTERLEADLKSRTTELRGKTRDLQKVEGELQSEQTLRKRYFNAIEDMKGKIRVYCRVRPLSKTETANGYDEITTIPDEYSIDVKTVKERKDGEGFDETGAKQYTYDKCFGPGTSQQQIFSDTEHLIQSAVDGFNVCLFAYGQTGSGKTFTMIGPADVPEQHGIARRAISTLFGLIDRAQHVDFEVSCYMLELYNDRLRDLFGHEDDKAGDKDKDKDKLLIKKDLAGMVHVTGAETRQAATAAQLSTFMEEGFDARTVASTLMNSESSRSHLVFGVLIKGTSRKTGNTTIGKLSIVDLAGSERIDKSGVTGAHAEEAKNINISLSALGNVISALTRGGSQHIPYRDNKLTLLMSDSIGGNAKTLMFVNVSPADYNADETHNSLSYAARVKQIKNQAERNIETKQVKAMRSALTRSGDTIAQLVERAAEHGVDIADIVSKDGLIAGQGFTDASDGYTSGAGRSRRGSVMPGMKSPIPPGGRMSPMPPRSMTPTAPMGDGKAGGLGAGRNGRSVRQLQVPK